MQKLKDMKIKKRLNTGFKMVTGIATIAAVLGIIAMPVSYTHLTLPTILRV